MELRVYIVSKPNRKEPESQKKKKIIIQPLLNPEKDDLTTKASQGNLWVRRL